MKTIKVNDKVITFDMWDELKARDLAKIQKVQSKAKEWEEIEMMFWFVEQFCSKEDLEIVKDMNIKEFTEFSEQFAKIIDFNKVISEDEEKKN